MEAEKKILSYLQKYGNTKENDLLDFATTKLGYCSEDIKKALKRLMVKMKIHHIVHNRLEPPQVYILQEAAKLAEKRIGERFPGA